MKLRIKSLSTRLSIYILTITTTLFVFSFEAYFRCSNQAIMDEAFDKSNTQISNLALRIDAMLTGVEANIKSFSPSILSSLQSFEGVNKVLGFTMESNNDISCISIALEPYISPDKHEYLLINTFRAEDGYTTIHTEDNLGIDYREQDWYKIPQQTNKEYWSDPHYIKTKKDTIAVVTYCYPLKDIHDQFIGVITADLPLSKLDKIVSSERPFENSYSYLINQDGYYLVHRDSTRVLKETFFTANAHLNNAIIDRLGEKMLAGENGYSEYMLEDNEHYEFYHSVPDVGWSVGTVSRKVDILSKIIDTTHTLIIIIVNGLILIFLFTIYAIRRATRNIKKLSESTKVIAHGNFDAELPRIRIKDEIFELREAFVNMQVSLKDYIEQLKISTKNTERINSELAIATTIQAGMLPVKFPPYPELPEVELHAVLTPAKEVGGDLYDFLTIDRTFYFTIGDVSGKGVPASLLMAVTSSLFRSAVNQLKDLDKVMFSMNNQIIDKNNTGMFTTLILGALNIDTGELQYCNAGHNAPVLIRDNKASFIDVKPNLALGIMPNIKYTTQSMQLTPQDTLLLYTDGVTEAENINLDLYSNNRLLELLSTAEANQMSPKNLCNLIESSVGEFASGREPSDDLTMMAIKLKQPANKQLVISNDINELNRLNEFIEIFAEEHNISMAIVMKLQLALEEAVSNIIMHGYKNMDVNIEPNIKIETSIIEDSIEFVITDNGIKFNPNEIKEADTTLSLDERKIGGLGILLVHKIMDEVKYKRVDNHNVLTTRKKIL